MRQSKFIHIFYFDTQKNYSYYRAAGYEGYGLVKCLKIVKEARHERARQAERQRVAARQVK